MRLHQGEARAEDVLARALRSDNLDVTVKTILDALEIKTGDVAGREFTSGDRATYFRLNNCFQRAEFIRSWLVAELSDAAERVGENG